MKHISIRCFLPVFWATLALVGQSQVAVSQQPMSKAQIAVAQKSNENGFRLYPDENKRVIYAEFLSEAVMNGDIARGNAIAPPSKLADYPHLESIACSYGFTLTAEDVEGISAATSLKEIELGFVGASSESVAIEGDMRQWEQLKQLERIHLCKAHIADNDLAFVAQLPRLKDLEFNAQAPGLREDAPKCSDRCADFVSQASKLEYLWVHDAEGLTDRFVSKATSGLPNLKHFDMSSSRLTDESLRLLALRCRKLNWLDVRSPQFTDEGARHLGSLQHLTRLWLRSNALADQTIQHIKNLKRLQHLGLTVPTASDQDVTTLAGFRELEILALRRPALSDRQLEMFRNHPRLKSAFINGSQLSAETLVQVIQTLPRLAHLQIYGNHGLQRIADQSLGKMRHRERPVTHNHESMYDQNHPLALSNAGTE